MRGVIVAGTDTGVGKTLLSALLMLKMPKAVYWKPVQSGTLEETDSEAVARLSECDQSRIIPERYKLTQPLSPHLSARLEHTQIEPSQLILPETESFLIVELAGGVLVPLRDDVLQIGMVKHWELPVIIVARSTLGTINHTLLTLEALRARNINVAGVVMIGPPNTENEQAIISFGKTSVLGRIHPIAEYNALNLSNAFEELLPLSEWIM
jgi:dethiobiotin synthetase